MAYNKIHNRGEAGRREELIAAGTISPGMLIEVTTAGKLQAHSSEGALAQRICALENVLYGKGVDTDYVANDRVNAMFMAPGDVFNLLMAAGEDGVPGAAVISAGDGTLKCVDNASSAALIKDVIGYIAPDEPAFTTLGAAALKAIVIA